MTGKLHEKVVIVTGGASGLGESAARQMVADGATVLIVDIDDARGQLIAEELGSRAEYLHCDVAQETDIAAAVDHAIERYGRLDCMHNNAGFLGPREPIDELKVEDFDAAQAVLFRAVFLGTKHAARVMKPQRSGVILNTASIAGVNSGLGPNLYSASKAGIIHFTKNVAVELAPWSIRVVAIAPGKIVTPYSARFNGIDPDDEAAVAKHFGSRAPLPGRYGVGRDIAVTASFLISDDAGFVNGTTIVVDGGLTAGAKEGVVAAEG